MSLAKTENVRENAITTAKNSSTDIETLEELAKAFEGDGEIEALIATNIYNKCQLRSAYRSETSVLFLMEKLCASSEPSCRWTVAKNSCTPPDVLTRLAEDPVVIVRALVATNPNTPISILNRLFSDEKAVRDGLSGNPSTPAKLLLLLADDPENVVRARVALNSATPMNTVRKLAQDRDALVAEAAQKRLKGEE